MKTNKEKFQGLAMVIILLKLSVYKINPHQQKHNKMKTISAKLKIKCVSPRTKTVGTFLINTNSLKQITPTFKNMIDLCNYLNKYFPIRKSISHLEYELNIL